MNALEARRPLDQGMNGVVGEIGDLWSREPSANCVGRGTLIRTHPNETDATQLGQLRELEDAHVGEQGATWLIRMIENDQHDGLSIER